MHAGHPHDPLGFIAVLRAFQEAPEDRRGPLANVMSDAILGKHVDLAQVRRELIDGGEIELYDMLEQLLSLIEPYLQETGDME